MLSVSVPVVAVELRRFRMFAACIARHMTRQFGRSSKGRTRHMVEHTECCAMHHWRHPLPATGGTQHALLCVSDNNRASYAEVDNTFVNVHVSERRQRSGTSASSPLRRKHQWRLSH